MRTLVGIAVAVVLLTSMPVAAVAAVVPAKPSDFNGDGYTDLAIGAPRETIGGHSDAGGVNVLYGSPTGITSAGNQSWSQDSEGVPGSSGYFHLFGDTIASGDFDRDGYADLAVNARQDGTNPDVGSVTILYGAANGLDADGAQAWTDADLGALSGTEGFFGGLAAGDYDGDGYADLAIGVPGRDVEGSVGSGVVDIIFGGADGLTAVGAMQFSQASPGVPGEPKASQSFGTVLAAGDFSGDGIDDLAVGVPEDAVGSVRFTGSVNILYGSLDGPSGIGAQLWSQATPGIGGSPALSDGFGKALATGDFDRDGYDDLAIGVPWDKISSRVHAGAVNVIYGSASGLTASGSKWWHQGSAGVPGSDENADWFGSALASGDFDSDGADDLAIGAPTERVGRVRDAGAVTLLYGSGVGIRATGAVTLTQNSPGIPGKAETSDQFGSAVAAGDYGRSGRSDLAIGAYHEAIGDIRKSGVVDVLYGRLSGLSGIAAQSRTQDSPGVMGAVGANVFFGWDLTP